MGIRPPHARLYLHRAAQPVFRLTLAELGLLDPPCGPQIQATLSPFLSAPCAVMCSSRSTLRDRTSFGSCLRLVALVMLRNWICLYCK